MAAAVSGLVDASFAHAIASRLVILYHSIQTPASRHFMDVLFIRLCRR
jgi:hypothetical protein